jgi:hypothetical protein
MIYLDFLMHRFLENHDIKKDLIYLDLVIRQSSPGYQISHAGNTPSEVYGLILNLLVKTNCITLALAEILLTWCPFNHPPPQHESAAGGGKPLKPSTSKATFYSRFLDSYTKAHNSQWSLWLKYQMEPSSFAFCLALSNVHYPFEHARRGFFPGSEAGNYDPDHPPTTGTYGDDFKYCETSPEPNYLGIDLR